MKLRGADTEEIGRLIRDTIKSIKGVQLTKTSIVMSTYKETAQFPIDKGDILIFRLSDIVFGKASRSPPE